MRMSKDNTIALVVLILFAVFIAYEIAGFSDFFPDLHSVSYYAYRNLLLKIIVVVVPPSVYIVWILWHLSRFIPK
jgi:hypothetical protein